MTVTGLEDHAVSLGGQWSVWRDALLRTTGFPVRGLTALSAPECARVADDLLAGQARRDEFEEAFAKAAAHNSHEIYRIAADPLLREAITWQNLSALISVDKVLTDGPAPRRSARHRARERMIARYWQRYCGKTETVGFFGPVCWTRIDADEPAVTARPGAGVVRHRNVYFEYWPLAVLAGRLADEPAVRACLAPSLSPQLTLRERDVIDPVRPSVRLTAAQAAVLARCDGHEPAWRVAEAAASDPSTGLRSPADVFLLLDRLVRQGILRWDFDLPVSLDAERVLRERIGQIADHNGGRGTAEATLDALSVRRDDVAASAGNPDRLAEAMRRLDSAFTELSGQATTRRAGEAYAGRTLCVEETTRDLDVTFGRAVLDAIAAPLAVPLAMARWLCGALAEAYLAELERLRAELAAELGTADVPLGLLWFLAQDSFYGAACRPFDQVAAEFGRRWARLFDLDSVQLPDSRLAFSSPSLAAPLAELFPAEGPTWAAARIHSPDLQFCARNTQSFAHGDFSVVLGEMHVAWAGAGCGASVAGHPEPARLRRALRRDMEGRSIFPLLPLDWPRHTPRLAFALEDRQDVQLAFAAAPGADRQRLMPVSSLVVRCAASGLAASAPDGRSWPLVEVFGRLLSETAVEAFKSIDTGSHSPRITIDRLVVARESWRMTVGDCPVTPARGECEEYLATRRWKAARGLPQHAFVKLEAEAKPLFVDLTSPVYASMLAAALRATRRERGDAASLVVTEMLPGPDDAWVPDAAGRRYCAELRLHVRDDQAVRPETEGE